jgi:hypothetical protein
MSSELKSLAPVAAAPLVRNPHDYQRKTGFASHQSSSTVSAGSDTQDVEGINDGLYHQVIKRDGMDVLVSWSKKEERKVVRKADFLFLPLFTVCTR